MGVKRNVVKQLNPILPAAVLASLVATAGAVVDTDQAEQPDPIINNRLWTGFAGGPTRLSVANPAAHGPSSFDAPRWVLDGDNGRSFVFYGQTAVVTSEDLVIAVGYETDAFGRALNPNHPHANAPGASTPNADPHTHDQGLEEESYPGTAAQAAATDVVVAFSRLDGSLVWTANVPIALLDSWSAPCVDTLHNTVIVAAGAQLTALRLSNGSTAWTTSLGRIVVNASPVATHDLFGRNRAFITDHSYASDAPGKLYCVNTDPYRPGLNPFQPGQIVWSAELGGQTSGNTPAYADGVVYVSTASGGSAWDQGTIRALPATTNNAPAPLWVYQHTDPSGFFSGVAIRAGALYASSYSFHGGQYSASTVRLDRVTGQQRWSVPTNRTDTTPIPLDNGMVLVSGGVPFNSQFPAFGSLPSLELIVEMPWGATRAWDTAYATLNDANHNGDWDPGESFLSLGGWTVQPVVIRENNTAYALVGSSPDPTLDGFFGYSPKLTLIDLSKHPTSPGFVVETYEGCGSSPAITGSEVYTVGEDGVFAFGNPVYTVSQVLQMWSLGTLPDFNADGRVDLRDLYLALGDARP